MADTTKDIWNDDDGEEQKPKKRRKLPGILLFFLTLAAVLGTFCLPVAAVWPKSLVKNALKRRGRVRPPKPTVRRSAT